jgi:AcrR family transcriptional regulator
VRAKATVDAILTAAARILVQDGYERASVNRIAELAGVSVGSLYQYFPSKEALVAAVMARHAQRMIAEFQRDLFELAHLEMARAIRGIVERCLKAYAVDPALHRVIVEQVPKVGLLVQSHDFYDQLRAILLGYLEFHRARVRPRNHELAVQILVTSVEAVVSELAVADAKALESDEVADELATLILGYLEPRAR